MVSDQLQFMSEYIIYQFHSVDMFEAKIDHLSNYIIRPRRRQYAINDLGPTVFKTQYCLCTRQDFSVQFQYGSTYGYPEHCDSKNESKQKKTVKLQCSIFIPHCSSIAEHKNKLNSPKHFAQKDKAYRNNQTHSFISSERACVLSMHGNTGTRVSTLSNLQPVLKFGIAFACFDFAGCGLSQGDYVTLGYYQKYQISAVLEHIYKKYGYHKFMLYGRSMGAASSLFYSCLVYPEYVENKQKKIKEYYQIEQQLHRKLKKDSIELELDVLHKLNIGHFGYQVIGIILDSPYYDIKEMVMDLVKSKIWFVPKPLISYAIGKVSQRVKQKLTSVGITSMKERSLNEESKNKIEEQKKQQEFCLLKSTTISDMATIPFPVFVLYGLKDDVILRQHTLELFNRLATINKKLHVLQDQGHGDHRDQKVKIDALEWVLGFQYQRVDKRIQRDAHMIGIDVEQYTNWIFSHETEKEQKMIAKTAEKTKQIGSELTTQRTTSITSFKIGQVHVGYGGFGSLTSLDNYNPVQQQRKQEIVKKKTKEISSIELLQMSRIAPYQALLKKMGITTSNKLTKIRDKVNSNSAMKEEQINQIEICREPKQLDGSIEYVR